MELSRRGFVGAAMFAAVGAVVAETRPVLCVNADNDHFFCSHTLADELPLEERFTERGLAKYIDLFARGNRVTHLFACVVGQRANYDSKVCDPIWAAIDEAKARGLKPSEWAVNAKHFFDMGLDPYRFWCDYCRRTGKLEFWISQRMNDIHHVDREWVDRTSRFWYAHPELRRKAKIDPTWRNGGGWPDLAFDYSKPEVREYEFAIFRELVDRYDADGFELDFMRWWQNLSPGKGREQAPILTAFIVRCRAYLDGLEKVRGHRIGLAARCASSYEVARELGMDAEAWAREARLDFLIVANFFAAADFDCDLAAWRRRIVAANPRTRVVASACDNIGCADVSTAFSPEAIRGWADICNAEGVDGLYFFNIAYYTREVRSVILSEPLAKAPAAGGRRYICSYHDCTAEDDAMKMRQLPVEKNAPAKLTVNVGTANGSRIEVILGYDAETDRVEVRLNGVAATEAVREAQAEVGTKRDAVTTSRLRYAKDVQRVWAYRFPKTALKAGHNLIEVGASASSRLVWAEIDQDRASILK